MLSRIGPCLPRGPVTNATVAALALAAILFWVFAGPDAPMLASFIPARFHGPDPLAGSGALPAWITPLSYALVPGGLAELLLGLGLFLLLGRHVELALGGPGLVALTIAGALIGAGAAALVAPLSPFPLSGGFAPLSAVIGAYAALFGRGRRGTGTRQGFALLIGWAVIVVGLSFGTGGQLSPGQVVPPVAGFALGLIGAPGLLRWRYRRA